MVSAMFEKPREAVGPAASRSARAITEPLLDTRRSCRHGCAVRRVAVIAMALSRNCGVLIGLFAHMCNAKGLKRFECLRPLGRGVWLLRVPRKATQQVLTRYLRKHDS